MTDEPLDPTQRLADTMIRPELTAADVVLAAIAAQGMEQLGRERVGEGMVGTNRYAELKDRLYEAAATALEEEGLTPTDVEQVIDEVRAEIAIFRQSDT